MVFQQVLVLEAFLAFLTVIRFCRAVILVVLQAELRPFSTVIAAVNLFTTSSLLVLLQNSFGLEVGLADGAVKVVHLCLLLLAEKSHRLGGHPSLYKVTIDEN